MVICLELSKNDKIEITIDSLTSEGSGVGRYNGIAVFVRGTVPKDRIIAHIIKTSKKYAVGIIDEIKEPSPSRIESDCPYSQKCGGCSFRNMTYEEELKYKTSRVKDAVSRIAKLDIPVEDTVGCQSVDFYRNKAQYPAQIRDGRLLAGFYAYKSHRIIPCDDCRLQPKEFKEGLRAFAKWVKEAKVTSFDEKSGNGLLRHIYFRKAFSTGEIMACAVVNGRNIPKKDLLIKLLTHSVDGIKSIALNINTKNTNVILGNETEIIWGEENIQDLLLGKKFIISPNSFYQVNHSQCENLYRKAHLLAELTGNETVLDLYCGVGTIGITMADKVKRLVGVEIIPDAVKNAEINAALNGLENAEFICGDAPAAAKQLEKKGIKPDIIIVDPPRKGCDRELLETVSVLNPEKIIYISCDSATFARDLAILYQKGYHAKRITPFDMFPRTPHVETVCLLSKLNTKQHIEINFDMDEPDLTGAEKKATC